MKNMKNWTQIRNIGRVVIGMLLIVGLFSMTAMALDQTENKGDNTKKLDFPDERTIILRLDDVQGFARNNISINLTDTILRNDMSVTLGVVPGLDIDKDAVIKNYLVSKSTNPRVEIAQHGYTHQEHYGQMNEKEAYRITKLGRQKMISILGVSPVTFIPPYLEYNVDTLKAIKKLDFKIISPEEEYRIDKKILIVGYNVFTKSELSSELNPVDNIVNGCNGYLNMRNLCVVLIHPQDYASSDGVNMDSVKYNEFVKLLNGLKTLNARSVRFKDLLE